MQYRTHNTGEITEALDGQRIRAAGWVETIRDHGGVMFIDLRDHYGMLQVVLNDDSLLKGIGKEFCISVQGVLRKRTEDSYNKNINTGTVELVAENAFLSRFSRRPKPKRNCDSNTAFSTSETALFTIG